MHKNIAESLVLENFMDGYWLDKDTFVATIVLNEQLNNHFADLINDNKEESGEVNIVAEYWKDAEEAHYCFIFEHETVNVDKEIRCEYLDSLLLEYMEENESN